MRKTKPDKSQPLTYKDKTNFPVGTCSDIFQRNFFQEDDINKLTKSAFSNDSNIDKQVLRELLNNVIKFAVIVKNTKLMPGKSDKKKLIEKICEIAEDLGNHFEILMNKYGHGTFKHIPIVVNNGYKLEEIDTYEFLKKTQKDIFNLAYIRDVAKRNIDSESGKKTGNNSKNAIPNLIFHLVTVYERITSKTVKENFQQDPAGEHPYKGEFYQFTHCIFEIINENYSKRYPNTQEPNPFKIEFNNKHGEESHSLGKYIIKVLKLSENKTEKQDLIGA